MLRMHGGKREGSGRPMGAKNKRTVAVEAAMQTVAERFKAEIPRRLTATALPTCRRSIKTRISRLSCGWMRLRKPLDMNGPRLLRR